MISHYVARAILLLLLALPLYIVGRFVCVKIRHKSNFELKWGRELLLAVTSTYCFMLAWLLFEPQMFSGWSFDPRIGFAQSNFAPFSQISEYILYGRERFNLDIIIVNLVGNVLMFVPLGILLPLANKKLDSLKVMALVGLLLPITVEVIQLFIGRAADIDDVILNFVGVMLGYLIFIGVRHLFLKLFYRC